ncbi:MAG: glycosyltransferase [Desulfocurvibacter africanus]
MKIGYYLDRLTLCGETKAVGRQFAMLRDMGHEVLLFAGHVETGFDFGLKPIIVSGMSEIAAHGVQALVCTSMRDFRKTRACGCRSIMFHQASDLDRLREDHDLRKAEGRDGAIGRLFLGLKYALRRRSVRRHYRARPVRWVSTPYLYKMFREGYGQETALVRDYVDAGAYWPGGARSEGPRTVLCIGDSQVAHHNVGFVYESLRKLKAEQPFRLVRVSPRPIPASEAKLDMVDEFHVIESDAQMAALYREAGVLVASYLAEGVGPMALEAMACRTLCMLSAIEPHQRYADPLPEQPAQFALFHDPRDPSALPSLLNRLFRQPQVFERVRDAGLQLSRFYAPAGTREDLRQALEMLAVKR